jgi:hypothetical protein
MTIELKERTLESKLRYWADYCWQGHCHHVPPDVLREAVAEIARLKAREQSWQEALDRTAEQRDQMGRERDTALQRLEGLRRILAPVLELEVEAKAEGSPHWLKLLADKAVGALPELRAELEKAP